MNPNDGTLNLPTGSDSTLSNPRAAMNTMDGWSTTMPLVFNFKGAGLADGPVFDGVYLVKLTESLTGDNPVPEEVLTPGNGFNAITSAATDTLTILPTSDLVAGSEYIVVITDALTDINSNPVGTSTSYASLKSTSKDYTGTALEKPAAVIQGVEKLAKAAGADSPIVYSTWFSTQSVGDSLNYTKLATAAGFDAGSWVLCGKRAPTPIMLIYRMRIPSILPVPEPTMQFWILIRSLPSILIQTMLIMLKRHSRLTLVAST